MRELSTARGVALGTLMVALAALGGCSDQSSSDNTPDSGNTTDGGAEPTQTTPGPTTGVPAGAETIKDLLLRMEQAQADNDVALMMTCFPGSSDEAKAAANVLATDMLIAPKAHTFLAEGRKRFGSNFQRAVGPIALRVGIRSEGFKFAEAAETKPEIIDGVATLGVPVTVGKARMSFQRISGRWYIKPAKETPVAVAEARKLRRLIDEVGALTAQAKDLKEFSEKVIPVLERIDPEWAAATKGQRQYWTPGEDD